MISEKLKAERKQMFDQMEKQLLEGKTPEDNIFYHHANEDRIVLSHALFWVMTRSLTGKISKEKFLLLLRKYQEEMLEAYLTEDEYFPELLRYCNIMYNTLPYILPNVYNLSKDKPARRLSAIIITAAGYAGDICEEWLYDYLDNIDFQYNKVKCSKIEQRLPELNQYVENEMDDLLISLY